MNATQSIQTMSEIIQFAERDCERLRTELNGMKLEKWPITVTANVDISSLDPKQIAPLYKGLHLELIAAKEQVEKATGKRHLCSTVYVDCGVWGQLTFKAELREIE